MASMNDSNTIFRSRRKQLSRTSKADREERCNGLTLEGLRRVVLTKIGRAYSNAIPRYWAEDVAQEVVLSLWQGQSRWTSRIINYRIIDAIRKVLGEHGAHLRTDELEEGYGAMTQPPGQETSLLLIEEQSQKREKRKTKQNISSRVEGLDYNELKVVHGGKASKKDRELMHARWLFRRGW